MVASHFRDTLFEVGAPSELVDEAIVILGTCRPVFEAANRHASRMDSGDLGVVANQIQQLLKSSDHELEETKKKVRKILGNAKPENVVRMRSALRMRSVGLADLFDQAIASGAPAECPIHIDASPSAI